MTTIVVTHEDNEIDEFEFGPGHNEITVGRRSDNDVAVPNLSVSGKHAKITIEDGQAWLQDLASTNGTYVNGVVVSRHMLQTGDDIVLGKIRLGVLLSSVETLAMADASASMDQSIRESVGDHSADFSASSKLSDAANASGAELENMDEDELSFVEDARLFNQSSEGSESKADDQRSDLSDSDASGSMPSHPLESAGSEAASDDGDAPPLHELDSGSTSKGAVIEIKNGAKSGQILPIDKPVTTLGRPGIQIAAIMRKPDGYFLMHIESDESVDRPTLNQDAIGDEPVLLHSGDELNVAGIDVEFMLS